MNEIEYDNILDGSAKTESGCMGRIINLKHEPGAVDNGAVRIDRRTRWGNPFLIGRDGDRDQVIARYRADLWRRIRAGEIALDALAALHGRDLACHCAPAPCHGEVLARAAAWAAARLGQATANADAPGPDNPPTTPDSMTIGDLCRAAQQRRPDERAGADSS